VTHLARRVTSVTSGGAWLASIFVRCPRQFQMELRSFPSPAWASQTLSIHRQPRCPFIEPISQFRAKDNRRLCGLVSPQSQCHTPGYRKSCPKSLKPITRAVSRVSSQPLTLVNHFYGYITPASFVLAVSSLSSYREEIHDLTVACRRHAR
jgi:hypothetical protein